MRVVWEWARRRWASAGKKSLGFRQRRVLAQRVLRKWYTWSVAVLHLCGAFLDDNNTRTKVSAGPELSRDSAVFCGMKS